LKGNVVEQIYRRVDDLDEKIKEITLPYLSWKILFLIGKETSVDDLEKQLNKERSEIEKALALLVERGIVESTAPSEEKAPETEVTGEPEVEEEEVVSEEVEPEKEETAEPEALEEQPMEAESPEEKHPDDTSSVLEEAAVEEVSEETADLEEVEEKEESAEEEKKEKTAEEEETLESEEAESALDLEEAELKEKDSEGTEVEEESIDVDEKEEEEESVDLDFEEPQVKEEDIISTEGQESAEMTNLIEELDEMGGSTAKAGAEEAATDVKDGEKKKVGGKTIMVIDDSIVIRKMVEIALEEDDYRIVTAISGKEGMTVLDEENPDLVILDMMLPDMNGIDVLKTIKASKGIPVIMLSGKDSPQLVETAKGVGADDFLPKPFRDEELVEKVKNLLK
jgi:CheY-like chemotaxis protein